MVTLKNIIDDFSNIATNHYLINSFHSGFLDEVDINKEDLTNRNMVWTSTLQTTQDVVAEFRQNLALQTSGGDSGKKFSYVPDEAVLELPLSTEPFTARFANILTGWSTSMSIQVNNANNLCNAPIEPSDNNPNT
jgi:hypothetical protein